MLLSFKVCVAKTSRDIIKDVDPPWLDVKVTFPTEHGGREIKVSNVVADSSAQVYIFPARLVRDSGLQLTNVKSNLIKSASGSRVPVKGAGHGRGKCQIVCSGHKW